VIDLHSHLLPGVDDGSPSVEVSVAVLRRFAVDGVTTLVCTPHLNATEARVAPHEAYAEIFAELVASAPAEVALKLGWEIMLDAPGVDLRARHLRLGGSTAVLVEFQRSGIPARSTEELARIRESGLVPLVAHPERYWGCTTRVVREWRAAGAAIQTDATMLLGSGPMTRLAKEMLEEGVVDCIASDNHGDRRSLRSARQWLEEVGAAEQAVLLTEINPGRLLADQPTLPVPPIHLEKGMLGRLRELVFGRA
jgi:protein-tyrosine phosphatase